MEKKLLALILSVLLTISLFAGCSTNGGTDNQTPEPEATVGQSAAPEQTGDQSAEPKETSIGMDYEPETLDPANVSGDTSLISVRLSVESLLRDIGGQVKPGIAESYDVSDDMTVYTFHLRESTYSDGTAITANDFYYSIMRTLDPNSAFDSAYYLYTIAGAEAYNTGAGTAQDVGVEVIDDYTLRITMNALTFPIEFTQRGYAPQNQAFVESCGETYGAEAANVLTNGPYTITEWIHESTITFEKNESYWNAANIHLTKITAYINATGQTAADMMMTGELDACNFTVKQIAESVEQTGNYQKLDYNTGYQFIHINHLGKTEETGKWLSNVNFRKALSCAIDREALVAAVYTTDVPASRMTAPSELGVNGKFDEEYPLEGWSTTAEPEKAQEYLAAAMQELGVSDVSQIPEFTMLCYDSQKNMDCLNAVADMWDKTLGIKATIDAQPLSSMLDKAYAGDFDFWKGGKAFGLLDWVSEVAVDYKSTAGAPMNYANDQYDTLLNAVEQATTMQQRKDNLFALEQFYCDNMLDLVVTWMQGEYLARNDMTNILVTNDGYVDITFADING